MAAEKEQIYATLLLSDTYLPGALVLAHSLIDNGTTRKLAVLVTEDTVSREAITQLQAVYNYVIPVPRIRNAHPNLHLMNRADLHSAFTKIALWKQTQFSKIVYVDADVVAYRAPDELFDLDAPFSAAPDIGWPDIFNSGVMVLEPSEAEYERLADLASRGASFDGADQGLLNQHFGRDYNRISFTYNVTPSAHYQYIPAFKHFQDSISMVHFIGSQKPWFQGRPSFSTSGGGGDLSPHEGMIAKWWSVYDRHYGKDKERTPEDEKNSDLVKYFVKGEYWPPGTESHGQFEGGQPQPPQQPKPSINEAFFRGFPPPERVTEEGAREGYDGGQHYVEHYERPSEQHEEGRGGYPERHEHHHVHREYHEERHYEQHEERRHEHHEEKHYERHEEHRGEQHHEQHHEQPHGEHHGHREHHEHHEHYDHHDREHHREEYQPQPPPMESTWDAQWQPPPRGGRPEAESFPDTKYEMSRDITPFVPPERYPSPPRDMWYKVPEEPPAPPTEKPRPIFPWETHQPRPTRVFADYSAPEYTEEPHITSPEPPRFGAVPGGPTSPASETGRSVGFGEEKEVIESTVEGPTALVATPSRAVEHFGEPHTPPDSTSGLAPALQLRREEEPRFQASDFWASPSATNAWDEVPGIRRYIERVIDQTGLGGPRRYSGASRRQRQLQAAAEVSEGRRRGFFKAADFLSADERSSLLLTPAPLRTGDRGEEVEPVGFPIPPSGDERDEEAREEEEEEEKEEDKGKAGTTTTTTKPTVKPRLAEAKGVPTQSDWVCVHGRRWGPADCLCDLTNVLRVHKNPVEQLEKLASWHRLDPQSVLRRLSAEDPNARSREVPARSLPPSSEGVLLHSEQQQQQQQQWWRRHSHQEGTHFGYAATEEERQSEREYYAWSKTAAAKTRAGSKVVDTGTIPEGAPLLAPVPVKAGLPASKATTTTSRLIPGQIPPLLEPFEREREEGGGEEGVEDEKEGQPYRVNGHPRSQYEQAFSYSSPFSSSRAKGKGKGKGKSIPEPSYTGPGAAWEPGAYIPTNVSGALPPEEEMDVLDT